MEKNNLDLFSISNACQNLISSVGQFIKTASIDQVDISVKEKNLNNLVTEIDKEAERKLVLGLQEILPNSGFITEEKTVGQIKNDYTWIIDPLDGTTNFIHQVPFYSISVALRFKEQIILGIVYDICHDNLYHATLGTGAFKNNEPISVSATNNLSDSLVATGFPYDDFNILEDYMTLLKFLMQSTRGIRRLGSAALDLCFVAEGKFDIFFEYNLEIWDVAAGAFIVAEAGGRAVVDGPARRVEVEKRSWNRTLRDPSSLSGTR